MSLFVPGKLTCFICGGLIQERIDAAHLFYAHPDDVGDIARHGRAWVHRRCWEAWDLRAAWSSSAATLLAREPGSIRSDLVVCRRAQETLALRDAWNAVELAMPWDTARAIAKHLNKAEAAHVEIKASSWDFVPTPQGFMVSAEQDGETFERLVMDGASWAKAIDGADH